MPSSQSIPSNKTRSSSLKQGTLSFASTKRTASTTGVGKPKKASTAVSSRSRSKTGSEEDSYDDIHSDSLLKDDEDVKVRPISPIPKAERESMAESSVPMTRSSTKRSAKASTVKEEEGLGFDAFRSHSAEKMELETISDLNEDAQRPTLFVKDPKLMRFYRSQVRPISGNLPFIHAENQNNIHHILRVFDLNYDYGPCIGVTRLERWTRAKALGLNPPTEVRDILTTREGVEKTEYSECVFYDEV